jgi:lipid A 3-O-deacylase
MTNFPSHHGLSCRSKAGRLPGAILVLAVCAASRSALAASDAPIVPAEPLPSGDFTTWRFSWDNDVVVSSDNEFSNGMTLQVHGPPARTLADARGTPAFGKSLARWFLPVRRQDLLFREGWSIGQSIQTPDDLEREDLIVDDVPYAAALAVQNTWIAYDDSHLYGFGWLTGVIGPAALGEQVQKGFHRLTGAQEPMGWDNQLKNEPLINLYYEQKRKLVGGSFGDIAAGAAASVGNLVTGAEVRLEGRLGWHVPRGFLYTPDPIGRHLSYDSHLPPREPTTWALYGSFSAGAGILGYTAFFDGNLFRDSHSVEYDRSIQNFVFGLHFQRLHWGVHLNVATSPKVVDRAPDSTDKFATLMFELRH